MAEAGPSPLLERSSISTGSATWSRRRGSTNSKFYNANCHDLPFNCLILLSVTETWVGHVESLLNQLPAMDMRQVVAEAQNLRAVARARS